jgi:hypothetical protein
MGIAYNTSIVRSGLILHLDAANVKSYPGSGTTWFDLSGGQNHITLKNGVTFDTNKRCFIFDGTDDYGDNSGENLKPDNISMFSVCRITDLSQSVSFVGGYGNTGLNGYWIANTGNNYKFSAGNGNYHIEGSLSAPQIAIKGKTDTIEYVGGTFDGNFFKTYDKGILINNVSHDNPGSLNYTGLSGGFIVGNVSGFSAARYWTGEIYTIAVYNRALTATEVKQNFEALRGRYGI